MILCCHHSVAAAVVVLAAVVVVDDVVVPVVVVVVERGYLKGRQRSYGIEHAHYPRQPTACRGEPPEGKV